jgi:serine/threonine protein kinase
MELAGKSLKTIEIRSDPEVDEVRSIFREVLLGLHDLHQLQIAHRNIEPGNIMISHNRKVKIIDY